MLRQLVWVKKKHKPLLVGQRIQLDGCRAIRKKNIMKVIVEHLIDDDIFEEEFEQIAGEHLTANISLTRIEES